MNKKLLYNFEIDEFEDIFDIMEKSFPNTEFREYSRQKELLDDEKYNIYVCRHDNKVIGFIAYWDFDKYKYIEHFAVAQNERGKQIGKNMLLEFVSLSDKIVVLEVELPEGDIEKRRIEFYKRCGFFYNEYNYLQPPIRNGQAMLPLRIMSYGRKINENEYINLKNMLYKFVYKY